MSRENSGFKKNGCLMHIPVGTVSDFMILINPPVFLIYKLFSF
jgi:hypothetical protein